MSKTQETVTACPECDKPHIRARKTMSPTWLCRDCRAEFEEPRERPPRERGKTPADEMFGQGTWKELKLALWRSLDAGSRYATARIVSRYSDELDSTQIGAILSEWGVNDGLVDVWSESGNEIRYCITIDGGIDDG